MNDISMRYGIGSPDLEQKFKKDFPTRNKGEGEFKYPPSFKFEDISFKDVSKLESNLSKALKSNENLRDAYRNKVTMALMACHFSNPYEKFDENFKFFKEKAEIILKFLFNLD
jgi:hypothetical protein